MGELKVEEILVPTRQRELKLSSKFRLTRILPRRLRKIDVPQTRAWENHERVRVSLMTFLSTGLLDPSFVANGLLSAQDTQSTLDQDDAFPSISDILGLKHQNTARAPLLATTLDGKSISISRKPRTVTTKKVHNLTTCISMANLFH